ncbi:DUF3619 family protein [Ideonella sp.]|uniref:DUF3619 family protein n=1 Tax=Ideonella sp. TaxID=1929293 RepID=UPI002B480BC3|nr:DUF3619 family protein [Ideonella sp.]HJV72353.1 DUF3619 family protein [Ideonella sp.]
MNGHVIRPANDVERIEARFGLRIGALLNERAERTPHDISERLRVAREQAIAQARASRLAGAPADLVVGTGRTAVLGRQPGWLFRFASVVPLVLLVAGMVLIDEWHDRAQIEAAAEVDVALLADELPPDAYSDAGFVEFLKEAPQ